MRSVLRHFTYANVMVTLLALTLPTGIAFGAVHLGKNVVKTVNIAPAAVTGPKIASSAVTAAKIKPGAVTASKIKAGAVTAAALKPGSLTLADLKAGQLPGGTFAFTAPYSQVAPEGQFVTVADSDAATQAGGPVTVSSPSVLMTSAVISLQQSGSGTNQTSCDAEAKNLESDKYYGLTPDYNGTLIGTDTDQQTAEDSITGGADVPAGRYDVIVTCAGSGTGNSIAQATLVQMSAWATPQ